MIQWTWAERTSWFGGARCHCVFMPFTLAYGILLNRDVVEFEYKCLCQEC